MRRLSVVGPAFATTAYHNDRELSCVEKLTRRNIRIYSVSLYVVGSTSRRFSMQESLVVGKETALSLSKPIRGKRLQWTPTKNRVFTKTLLWLLCCFSVLFYALVVNTGSSLQSPLVALASGRLTRWGRRLAWLTCEDRQKQPADKWGEESHSKRMQRNFG